MNPFAVLGKVSALTASKSSQVIICAIALQKKLLVCRHFTTACFVLKKEKKDVLCGF